MVASTQRDEALGLRNRCELLEEPLGIEREVPVAAREQLGEPASPVCLHSATGSNPRAISGITRTARRISSANLRESIPTTGAGDELDELAQTLNAMMERIRRGVASMHRFNAMLRLSRSEAGLEAEDLQCVPVAPLLETTVEFFDPVASDRGIRVEVDALPEAEVRGDPEWLCQMFSNLLDNAIKYCSQGDRIRVTAAVRQPWLVTRVSDTGPGIAPEDLGAIFDRFQRGSRHRNRPGFGLGLPIAQEIARAHGGRIEAESGPSLGTTFSVWLPLASVPSPSG